jgi:hypothetical protein
LAFLTPLIASLLVKRLGRSQLAMATDELSSHGLNWQTETIENLEE